MELIEKDKNDGHGVASIGVLDAICERRAVRHYSPRTVDENTVKVLLEYAVQAPSAVNSQPWSFVVVQNSKLLKEISDEAKKILTENSRWKSEDHHSDRFLDPSFNIFYNATTLIIVCADREGLVPEADCYLASQNLMLAAYAMGLGSCPIGLAWEVLRTDSMKAKLGIKQGHFPVLPIIFGYASEPSPKTSREAPQVLNWIR
jgi:nitroreductase